MPTSLGHALAGLTVLWCFQASQHRRPSLSAIPADDPSGFLSSDDHWRSRGMAVACVCLAIAPDLDLVAGGHRTVTHSVTGAVVAGVAAAWIMRGLGRPALRTGLAFGLVWGTHFVLDWMGSDSSPPYGVMALWPFSDTWFISNLDVFADVSRRYWLPQSFWLGNLAAVTREVVILGPLAAAAWWWARDSGRLPRQPY